VHEELSRTVTVAAPPSRVWDALLDVRRVAGWLPIVRDVRETAPDRYAALLQDRIGPFSLKADLAISRTADRPRMRVDASGEDRQVGSRITANVDLAVADADGGTSVAVSGGYDITGRIATLGAGAIRKKGEHVLEEFFANMTRDLSAA
jgi:uncharacterized protein